jgi:hypothetical protein
MSTDVDNPLERTVKPRQDPQKGGFSGSVGPEDPDKAAGRDPQILDSQKDGAAVAELDRGRLEQLSSRWRAAGD